MSFAELHALLPQLILALGATVILMLGAWWPSRSPWDPCKHAPRLCGTDTSIFL